MVSHCADTTRYRRYISRFRKRGGGSNGDRSGWVSPDGHAAFAVAATRGPRGV